MVIDEHIQKIITKAKNLKFFAQKDFSLAGRSLFVCAQEIATHPAFPDFYFVIDSNMIYHGNQLKDSSYTVYSFTKQGDFIQKNELTDLPGDFFKNRVTEMKIE